MDGPKPTNGCPRCRELEAKSAELEAKVAELAARIEQLEGELAKARKDSGNSSKPPSSDIVKPPKQGKSTRRKKRKRGGQRGHARHVRPAFAPEEIDHTWEYTLQSCPDCGSAMEACEEEPPKVVQQVELAPRPVEVHEHRGLACRCRNCEKVHHAPIDPEVRRAGLAGPRLTALVAYLKGACHCSFTTIRDFVRDALGVTVSRGYLAKVIAKVADSLDRPYAELLAELPEQAVVNVDETGHKDRGERMWTWCFRASRFSLFKVDPRRSSDVLLEVLGEDFNGVLGCDYFSAYRKYMKDCNVAVQFCLAHLIRDLKVLVSHPDRRNRAYGRRLLSAVRELFALFHRSEKMSADRFALEIEDAMNVVLGSAQYRVPKTTEAQNIARRFEDHGESYLRFLTTPGVEPTNNLAERAIRFVVIDRKVTQGSRSDVGQRWLERIWTVIATCAQQHRSAFAFLGETIRTHLNGQPAPTLVFDTS
jgi:transposase